MWVVLVGCDGSILDKYQPIGLLVDTGADTGLDTADTDTGSTVDGLVHCGPIEGNETWGPGAHQLTCDVEVQLGTLEIQAGASITVADGAGLVVGDGDYASGIWIAGTEEYPVLLAAGTEEGWSGLSIYGNATATLSHVTLRGAGDDRHGGLHVEGTTVAIDTLTVEDAALCGIKLLEGARFADGATGVQVSGADGAAVCANLNAVGGLPSAGSAYVGNALDQVSVTGSDLTESATWHDLGVPYAILDRFSVNGTAELPVVLTLESGVEMAMADGTSLSFSDAAGASGLVATDVVFTALGAEIAGAWDGLNFERGTLDSTALVNVEVGYAGGDQDAALRVSGASVLLDGVSVHDSLSAGIGIEGLGQLLTGSRAITSTANALPLYAAPNAIGSLPAGELDFAGNTEDLIEMRGDDQVYGSATWASHAWDYRIDTNITLVGTADAPTVVTVEPGAQLLFTSDRRIEIGDSTSGALYAVGTTTDPIAFLPYDAYTAGSWGGILFFSDTVDDDSALENVEIGWGGGSRSRAGLQISGASPDVRDSHIHDSFEYGIYGECTSTIPTGMYFGGNAVADEFYNPC